MYRMNMDARWKDDNWLLPREASSKRLKSQLQAVMIDRGANWATRHWSLILAPSEEGIPSKTGTMDDSILLDLPGFKWMDAIWKELHDAAPGDIRRRPLAVCWRKLMNPHIIFSGSLGEPNRHQKACY